MAGISQHIVAASAAMVGVCVTAIGIVQILAVTRKFDTIADDLLVADAVVFLVACLLAHASIRTENGSRRLDRLADAAFIVGLALMIVVCGVLVYAVE